MKKIILFFLLNVSLIVSAQSPWVGTWHNDNSGTLVLNANGEGSLSGNTFNYAVDNGILVAYDEYGVYYLNIKVNANQLTINGELTQNTPIIFTKTKGNALANQSVNKMNQNVNNEQGIIDQSIVGTWCWTNASATYSSSSSYSSCIVINADGTYQYNSEGSISAYGGGGYGGSSSQNSDYGTWRVSGNTIHVVSAKEGAKTYSFEKRNHPKNGDPMIIIDGDAYVSYYQKAPWR